MIPRLAAEGGQAGEFFVGVGAGAGKDDGAGFALDEHEVIDEEGLAGAEAAVFPAALAGGGIDAGEEAVVEAVDETVAIGRGVELVFHAAAFPQLGGGELAGAQEF